MTKDEQIDYLKTKLTVVENEYQNNLMVIISLVISAIIMIVGIYLLISDEYVLGVLFVFLGFAFMVYKLVKVLVNDRKIRNKKFIELEGIRSSINSILK
jgi:ABC-type bacteriocin/lantibiotic exporter with double-glycine peptidase domain